MRNLKLTLAYDGSAFHGWAVQPNVASVQGTLIETVSRITQEKVRVYGAGRTDAGVHALGQVANFKTRATIPAENFQRALNALLPAQIRVLRVEEMGPEFEARWNATGKIYRYRILRAPVCPPFLYRQVYHYPHPLDEESMVEAAPFFEGEHDFSSFCHWEEGDTKESRQRMIFSSSLTKDEEKDELVYTVHGRSFLRYMVRKIVGTLLAVGKGRIAPEDIPGIFEACDRSLAGATAPPEGLYMVEVQYPDKFQPITVTAAAQTEKDSV
jgi:tRNA pseudouridine38-40 synthase